MNGILDSGTQGILINQDTVNSLKLRTQISDVPCTIIFGNQNSITTQDQCSLNNRYNAYILPNLATNLIGVRRPSCGSIQYCNFHHNSGLYI